MTKKMQDEHIHVKNVKTANNMDFKDLWDVCKQCTTLYRTAMTLKLEYEGGRANGQGQGSEMEMGLVYLRKKAS